MTDHRQGAAEQVARGLARVKDARAALAAVTSNDEPNGVAA